ncbi:CRISPR-associated protein Cas4 [Thermoflexus sp.]|uniref:CRISPR-associated protein Cas4 n=1 Tax=Thermoflexus sp. TaxID=1969742 RepID=UPI0035E43369
MGVAGVCLLLLALLIGGLGWFLRRRAGLPRGEVVYEDMSGAVRSPPLSVPRYGLIGKPDYLIRRAGFIIPVEVKAAAAPRRPHPSHVMQLIAYCLLVEETYGRPPPYGWIRYRDRTFRVDYTAERRDELLEVLAAMRRDLERGEAHRQHRSPARCRACGFRAICDEALA